MAASIGTLMTEIPTADSIAAIMDTIIIQEKDKVVCHTKAKKRNIPGFGDVFSFGYSSRSVNIFERNSFVRLYIPGSSLSRGPPMFNSMFEGKLFIHSTTSTTLV